MGITYFVYSGLIRSSRRFNGLGFVTGFCNKIAFTASAKILEVIFIIYIFSSLGIKEILGFGSLYCSNMGWPRSRLR